MVIPSRGFSRVQRLRSGGVELEVLPAVPPPPELAGATWLPASRVTLTETWADGRAEFALGVPRTRTLAIEAEGLLETQLPELALGAATGVRQYPDQPELERELGSDGLTVRRTERYAVIAQSLGEVAVPAVELPWWNVREERWEVARIEARTIPVVPGTEPAVESPVAVAEPASAAAPSSAGANYWPLIAAALGGAWLATILLWLRARNGSVLPRIDGAAPRETKRTRAETPSSRRILKQLRAACTADDAQRAQRLLLEWAKLQFAPAPPHSLGVLRERLAEPLAGEVGALEAHLYGPAANPWTGTRLAALLADLDTVARPPGNDGKDPLVPLYR
jgi:hypothetical protein